MDRRNRVWALGPAQSVVGIMRFLAPARGALRWERGAARSSLLCVLLPLDAWLNFASTLAQDGVGLAWQCAEWASRYAQPASQSSVSDVPPPSCASTRP